MDKEKNLELYFKKLSETGVSVDILREKYGEKLLNGTYNFSNRDNGCGDGELLNIILRKLTPTALNINKLLPEEKQAEVSSIIKVCLLSQISKVVLVTPNDNKWEIENRGMLYKFNDNPYAMKMGIRSIAMCMECGITLTENEIEAISNIDKEEDKQMKFFSSPLAIVLRQAMELTDVINRKR